MPINRTRVLLPTSQKPSTITTIPPTPRMFIFPRPRIWQRLQCEFSIRMFFLQVCFQEIPSLRLEGLEVADLETGKATGGCAGVEETGEVPVVFVCVLFVVRAAAFVWESVAAVRDCAVESVLWWISVSWTLRWRVRFFLQSLRCP